MANLKSSQTAHLRKLTWIDGILALIYTVASFLIYRYLIADLPRADHIPFMIDREAATSNLDFVLRTLSFSLHPDHYFFRPLFHLFLSLRDIFFREHLYAIGISAIILHAATSFLFYLFASRLLGRVFGFLISLPFLVQYAGLEMLHWTHIHGYLIGLSLLIAFHLHLLSLSDSSTQTKSLTGIWVIALCVVYFHEFFMLTFLGTGFFIFALSLFGNKNQSKDFLSGKKVALLFLAPAVIYQLLDALDYLFYNPAPIAHNLSVARSWAPNEILGHTWSLNGVFSLVFTHPSIVHLSLPIRPAHVVWDSGNLPSHWITWASVGGVLFLILCFAIFLFLFYQPKKREIGIIGFSLLFFYLAIPPTLAATTYFLNLPNYLNSATYYYYVTNYLFLSLTVLLLHLFLGFDSFKKISKWIVGLFLVLLLARIPNSYVQIQNFLKPLAPFPRAVSRAIVKTREALHSNDGYCYGGTLDPELGDFLPAFFFYHESCVRSKKQPAYLMRGQDGGAWLFTLTPNLSQITSEFLNRSDFSNRTLSFAEKTIDASLSSRSLDSMDYFKVHFSNAKEAGLVLSYKDLSHFTSIVSFDGELDIWNVAGYELSEQLRKRWIRKKDFDLTLARIGDAYYLFENDRRVIALIPELNQLNGTVGIICHRWDSLANSCFTQIQMGKANHFRIYPVEEVAPKEDLQTIPKQLPANVTAY